MQLQKNDLKDLCLIAIDAATKAGKYIGASVPTGVTYKAAGSSEASQVVTEVDRHSQELILEALRPSIIQYDLGLLAEESEDDGSRLEKDCFWCIDPLDGTLPFIEGRLGSAVAISLIDKQGRACIGVMYEPQTSKCFSAYAGGGALLDGEPYQPCQTKEDYLTIIHHRSLMKQAVFNSLIDEMKLKYDAEECQLIHHGGAVMNALWNLEHYPSVYFAYPKKTEGGGCLWDYAASVCFYQELGACVSDYFGNELNLNPKHTIYMNEYGVKFTHL